jgi:hypothetical protein
MSNFSSACLNPVNLFSQSSATTTKQNSTVNVKEQILVDLHVQLGYIYNMVV